MTAENIPLKIFADGSWANLTNAGGYAALVQLADNSTHVVQGSAFPTSIERMELTAIVEGLRFLENTLRKQLLDNRLSVAIINDREDVIRQISGEFDPNHNLDLWYQMQFYHERFNIIPIWMERNSHPALLQVDLLSAHCREIIEYARPEPGHEIFSTHMTPPEPLEEDEHDPEA
jgi:ribonuclease HI